MKRVITTGYKVMVEPVAKVNGVWYYVSEVNPNRVFTELELRNL